jgi:mRNA interferase HigB
MRVIARSTLVAYYQVHPETKRPLERWFSLMKGGSWNTTAEVKAAFSSAVVLNAERVRFEIAGGDYRLICAFKFGRSQIAFVKFIGTHAEYDRIDALTVSQF